MRIRDESVLVTDGGSEIGVATVEVIHQPRNTLFSIEPLTNGDCSQFPVWGSSC
jgi:hypothetical protein